MEELFKIRTATNDYDFALLEKNQLYFNSSSQFNDPFDCAITFDQACISMRFHKEMIKKVSPPSASREKRRQEQRRILRYLKKEKDNPKNLAHEAQLLFNQTRVGICALTKRWDSIPMWGYYGDSHRGFCIGYDKEKLRSLFNAASDSDDRLVEIFPVTYKKDYPIINPEKDNHEEIFSNALTIKSLEWYREEEERVIWANGAKAFFSIEDESYTRVILGISCRPETEKRVKEILSRKKIRIKLFKAKKASKRFAIDLEEVKF